MRKTLRPTLGQSSSATLARTAGTTTREQIAEALRVLSVQDLYCLVFGPDNPEHPGRYLVRVMLAVPKDAPTDRAWTAISLERARAMMPSTLVRWPRVRTTPRPALSRFLGLAQRTRLRFATGVDA